MQNESSIFQEYEVLKSSGVGKNLIAWIQLEHDQLISKAEKCDDPQEAFGYLKTAYGIIMIIEHINLMAQGNKK
tara:strand:- start:3090 stop:3311 length:222 start_codon:yes stop_codon:yes gene_type:complete